MGMYDIVLVPCPNCGEKEEFQSKGGECLLLAYELHDCPSDVLSDVNRHSPYTCENCQTVFEVNVEQKMMLVEKIVLVGKSVIY